MTAKLLSLLNKPEIAAFFIKKPGRELKRETEYLSGPEGGKLKRVDRLLIEGGRAVIVDFKTGGESAAYQDKIRAYAAAVSEATGLPAEGWLIYLDEESAEKVL